MQNGKDTILLVQSTDAALASQGLLIGNLTENSYSIENEVIDEQTKFGRIVGYGQNSESFDFSAYGEQGDPGQKAVLDAIKNKKQIKIWEVDINLNANGKHDAVFAYCVVESVEKSHPQDGFTEISATAQVIGSTQTGEINPLPADMLEFAKYGFEAPGAATGEFPDQDTAVIAVTGVSLNKAATSLVIGEFEPLIATVAPSDASNKNVTYESSAPAIATVDSTGKVTAVSAGSATITVTTVVGSFTDTCAVTVTAV